jgi:translation initiation factor RLI1
MRIFLFWINLFVCWVLKMGRANVEESTFPSFEEVLAGLSDSSSESNLHPVDVTYMPPNMYKGGSHVTDIDEERHTDSSQFGVDDDIYNACVASNAHGFISSFSHRYDTDVGEKSVMISGGQKQRIALARALVKRPAILLLDEATSALDAASEQMVQQSIDALQQSRAQTTLVIAHRLSTIRNADRILVVDGGMIVQEGSHDILVETPGLYSTLWHKQQGTQSVIHAVVDGVY